MSLNMPPFPFSTYIYPSFHIWNKFNMKSGEFRKALTWAITLCRKTSTLSKDL